MLATLGEIVFEASAELVRTFDAATLTTSGRWAQHEIIGKKPLQEFLGPGLRSLHLAVRLDAALGVRPENEAELLRTAVESGSVLPFLLGGVSRGDWVATSITEVWRNVTGAGVVQLIVVDVTLEEYR